nr:prolyl oligopeptidase family [uncultured bacterium]
MNNRREFCSFLGLALLGLNRKLFAQQESDFVAKSFQNSRGKRMPYRLFIPAKYESRQKYPLVLWLHGGAGRGSDNSSQISGGNTIGPHVWTLPENQSRNPCFVFAPQCPVDEEWATISKAQPSEQLHLALEILQLLQRTFSIDDQRLYVTGQSLGGFGTWSAITTRPKLFAAAIPVCGGGDESQASKLINTPIWAFHGEKDEAVSVERSRSMVEAIKKAGGTPRYTEYKDAGHVIWERVFHEAELLPWVFSQRRTN